MKIVSTGLQLHICRYNWRDHKNVAKTLLHWHNLAVDDITFTAEGRTCYLLCYYLKLVLPFLPYNQLFSNLTI